MDAQIYYTSKIENFEGKKQYLRQCFGENLGRYLSYYIPLCAFHDNWVNLSESSFQKEYVSEVDFYKTMGYSYTEYVREVEIPDSSAFEQKELSELSLKTLDEMVSICNENDIDIIFFTVPWQGEYAYAEAMKQYAEDNGCVYFNMFEYVDEIGFDGKTDFVDKGHLNLNGANKVADFLGKYIVENYNVTDFRTVDNNIWEINKAR